MRVGFNVLTGEYVDLVEAGVIDPLKVTRAAVENAMSIALKQSPRQINASAITSAGLADERPTSARVHTPAISSADPASMARCTGLKYHVAAIMRS